MSRWLALVGVGLLGALVAVVLLRPASPVTSTERVDVLAAALRCPDCQGLSVADSPTGSAREIRRQIGELVASGASDAEVRERFVSRYGEWILLAPSAPALWILPIVVVVTGSVGLGAWLLSRRGGRPLRGVPLSADERQRIHDEAEALDA